MKKIILTTLYPFWLILSKTWMGNMFMIPIYLAPLPILIHLIRPDYLITTGKEAQGIGIFIAMLSFLCIPLTGRFFVTIGDKLESNYKKWNYKTKMF